MKLRLACIILFQLISVFVAAQSKKEKHVLLFTDTFNKEIDPVRWISEIEQKPGSLVYSSKGKLVLDTKGGVTVWFNKLLKGNVEICFTRKVVIDSGENDRLSDLNVFWMARDLKNANLFTRKGVFEEYDSLNLYYVGMGGNTNSTTRFRKYDGKAGKPLLTEYTDKVHLLEANKEYHIKIKAIKGIVSFWVDDVCYFLYDDPDPLKEGYFGFRSTFSRQEIDDFRVYRVK